MSDFIFTLYVMDQPRYIKRHIITSGDFQGALLQFWRGLGEINDPRRDFKWKNMRLEIARDDGRELLESEKTESSAFTSTGDMTIRQYVYINPPPINGR